MLDICRRSGRWKGNSSLTSGHNTLLRNRKILSHSQFHCRKIPDAFLGRFWPVFVLVWRAKTWDGNRKRCLIWYCTETKDKRCFSGFWMLFYLDGVGCVVEGYSAIDSTTANWLFCPGITKIGGYGWYYCFMENH